MEKIKKEKPIMRNPTQSEEFKQTILERMLNDLCYLAEREIFIMLPEDPDQRIPYIKKEIIKTLEEL
tara:strand:+ start:541 stop:741 length:201 start_codon:yes stop_codon:yes gene_type:complete